MADEVQAKDKPLKRGRARQPAHSSSSTQTLPTQVPLPLIVSAPLSQGKWTHRKHFIEIAIAALALVVPFIGTYYHEERETERQAQAAIAASQLQLRISRDQLAPSLLPSIVKGSRKERESALLILSSAAPDLAKQISINLERNAQTPQEKQLAQEVKQPSNQASEDQEFSQHLERARVYQRFQLYPQADREYILASEINSSRIKVDSAKLKVAKSLYASDKWNEAARLFDEMFGDAASH
jgi:hypothetical protein